MNKILNCLLKDFTNTYKKIGFIKSISIMAIAGAILMLSLIISFWLEFFIVTTFWIIWIIEAIGETDKQNIFPKEKKT